MFYVQNQRIANHYTHHVATINLMHGVLKSDNRNVETYTCLNFVTRAFEWKNRGYKTSNFNINARPTAIDN